MIPAMDESTKIAGPDEPPPPPPVLGRMGILAAGITTLTRVGAGAAIVGAAVAAGVFVSSWRGVRVCVGWGVWV